MKKKKEEEREKERGEGGMQTYPVISSDISAVYNTGYL